MTEIMVQIIFGWPAIVVSILLSILGLYLKKPLLLVVAGIIIIPFTYYVSNGFRSPALVLPFFQFGSAYAISRQKTLLASLLLTPLVFVAIVLVSAILSQ